MSERTWDFNVTRTTTYKVQLTEAEILAFLKSRNLDLPDVSEFEPTDWQYVLSNWTDQVYEAINDSGAAVGDLVALPNAEVIEEEEDFDIEVDPETSTEEDEEWRPQGWQAPVTEDEEPDPFPAKASEPWTKVATLVPDREPVEWWR